MSIEKTFEAFAEYNSPHGINREVLEILKEARGDQSMMAGIRAFAEEILKSRQEDEREKAVARGILKGIKKVEKMGIDIFGTNPDDEERSNEPANFLNLVRNPKSGGREA